VDDAITHWINAAAGQSVAVDTAMRLVSAIGVPLMVILCVMQWWVGPNRHKMRHILVAAGLSFLAGLAFNQFLLLFIHRPRPYDAGITHLIASASADWSFPSDHATAVFAIVAAFALHAAYRRAALFGVIALLVVWSRVFIGTHYVSDILGGAATGLAAAALVRWLYPAGTRLDQLLTGLL
jgi:undecaprenyl-diphosphatase